jgi:predicted metal-dependent hydrolase
MDLLTCQKLRPLFYLDLLDFKDSALNSPEKNWSLLMPHLKYIRQYSPELIAQVTTLIDSKRLSEVLQKRYPQPHGINTDKALYEYVLQIKNQFMRKSAPVSKVAFDNKLRVIEHALGQHTFISRVQGKKLKSKNEIRVASLFKNVPEEFLRMIVVHELAHFKEKDHNKGFYKLCKHMEPAYHQLEFDLRLYLTHLDLFGKLY